jgi:hypothetical protein
MRTKHLTNHQRKQRLGFTELFILGMETHMLTSAINPNPNIDMYQKFDNIEKLMFAMSIHSKSISN